MTVEKPLPCPFCGSKNIHHGMINSEKETRIWFYVNCGHCGASMDSSESEAHAIELWNCRAVEN